MSFAMLHLVLKASGTFFVPSIGLAAHLAQSGHMHAGDHIHGHVFGVHHPGRAITSPFGYLLAPWGAGHLCLYVSALAAASARQYVRTALHSHWKEHLLGHEEADPKQTTHGAVLGADPKQATHGAVLGAKSFSKSVSSPAILDGVGGRHEGRLHEIFARFDTSGDGYLDAHELKLALRFVTGEDLGLEICERIVRAMDTDGDGVIDFHEFKAALASR